MPPAVVGLGGMWAARPSCARALDPATDPARGASGRQQQAHRRLRHPPWSCSTGRRHRGGLRFTGSTVATGGAPHRRPHRAAPRRTLAVGRKRCHSLRSRPPLTRQHDLPGHRRRLPLPRGEPAQRAPFLLHDPASRRRRQRWRARGHTRRRPTANRAGHPLPPAPARTGCVRRRPWHRVGAQQLPLRRQRTARRHQPRSADRLRRPQHPHGRRAPRLRGERRLRADDDLPVARGTPPQRRAARRWRRCAPTGRRATRGPRPAFPLRRSRSGTFIRRLGHLLARECPADDRAPCGQRDGDRAERGDARPRGGDGAPGRHARRRGQRADLWNAACRASTATKPTRCHRGRTPRTDRQRARAGVAARPLPRARAAGRAARASALAVGHFLVVVSRPHARLGHRSVVGRSGGRRDRGSPRGGGPGVGDEANRQRRPRQHRHEGERQQRQARRLCPRPGRQRLGLPSSRPASPPPSRGHGLHRPRTLPPGGDRRTQGDRTPDRHGKTDHPSGCDGDGRRPHRSAAGAALRREVVALWNVASTRSSSRACQTRQLRSRRALGRRGIARRGRARWTNQVSRRRLRAHRLHGLDPSGPWRLHAWRFAHLPHERELPARRPDGAGEGARVPVAVRDPLPPQGARRFLGARRRFAPSPLGGGAHLGTARPARPPRVHHLVGVTGHARPREPGVFCVDVRSCSALAPRVGQRHGASRRVVPRAPAAAGAGAARQRLHDERPCGDPRQRPLPDRRCGGTAPAYGRSLQQRGA